MLFIHRDAERDPFQVRCDEVDAAWSRIVLKGEQQAIPIPVIPVRMQEAWFLFDESAIREAAGNPNGRVTLDLPALKGVESLPDPKHVLYSLLKRASELQGRRLKKFHESQAAHRLAEVILDYSPNLLLTAFQALNERVREVIARL